MIETGSYPNTANADPPRAERLRDRMLDRVAARVVPPLLNRLEEGNPQEEVAPTQSRLKKFGGHALRAGFEKLDEHYERKEAEKAGEARKWVAKRRANEASRAALSSSVDPETRRRRLERREKEKVMPLHPSHRANGEVYVQEARLPNYPYPDPGPPNIDFSIRDESLTWNAERVVKGWRAWSAGETDTYERLENTVYIDPEGNEEEISEIISALLRDMIQFDLDASLTSYDQMHRIPEYYKEYFRGFENGKVRTEVPRIVLWVTDKDRDRLHRLVTSYESLSKKQLNARFSYEARDGLLRK